MKKKLLALLLLALLLSMSACVSTRQPITIEPAKATTESTEAATEPTEAATEPTEAATEPTEAATEPTEAATEPGQLFKHSKVEAGVYSSDFFGYKFTAPEGWSFYSDEQLAELSGLVGGMFDDEALREQITNSGVIYEMVAAEAATGSNVNLTVQDIGVMASLIHSEQEYADAAIPTLESMLSSAGYEVEFCRKGSVTFLGEERTCIEIQATYSGVQVTEIQIYTLVGSYSGVMTITVIGQEAEGGLAAAAEICNAFSPCDG